MRVTEKQIQIAIDRLNTLTGNPQTPYTKTNGKLRANVGNYHLDCAYGGYALNQMTNESGGVHDIFRCGHVPKRELFNQIQAYIAGIENYL